MNYKAIAKWATGGNTGSSSICIARHLMGMTSDGKYPHDSADFGRCEALLDAVPELRDNFTNMTEVNEYWAALVPLWDEIKEAKDKYRFIQSIVRTIEDKDPKNIRFGEGVLLRFGGP